MLEEDVKFNDSSFDITQLRCSHEESDTRIITDCTSSESDMLVVSARGTSAFSSRR